jgi:S1-C subfamily serine protease
MPVIVVACNLQVNQEGSGVAAVQELQEVVAGAVERVGPAVVGIGRGWGLGSGVVIAEGIVLTSAHNLRGAEATVSFAHGERQAGEVLGTDRDHDLAVIAVETGDAAPVEWDPSVPALPIGTSVVALANPGGRGLRATLGFVSSEGRSFRGPRGRRIENVIEHTAPLPRGSSGGPLLDSEGRLLGLNSLRLEGGLILAVPTTTAVRERVDLLVRGEAQAPHRLGVAVAPPRVARRMRRAVGLPERAGLLVRAVERGSAAEGAGVERGDLLVAARGRELDGVDGLYAALDAVPPGGGTLELTVLQGTEERKVQVTFGAREEAA